MPTPTFRQPTADTKRAPRWTGRVYSDEFPDRGDHVFASPYDFQYFIEQEFAMDPHLVKPDFVWVAKRIPPTRVDFRDVQYLIECCPLPPTPKSVEDLKAAIEAFNIANAVVRYAPDYTTIVPLYWDEPAPKKRKPAPEGEIY